MKIKEDAEIVEIEGKFFLSDGCMEERVKIGTKLNRAQRRRVMMLIKKYWNRFGNKLTGEMFEHNTEHKIAVRKNARPVRKRVLFKRLAKQEAMQKTVMDLLTRDMIVKGNLNGEHHCWRFQNQVEDGELW